VINDLECKDAAIIAFLDRLTAAGCQWRLQDHWVGDLCAVGVSSLADPRVLAYVSSWGQPQGSYHVELEAPARDEEPYETVGVIDSAELVTAVRLVSQHLATSVADPQN